MLSTKLKSMDVGQITACACAALFSLLCILTVILPDKDAVMDMTDPALENINSGDVAWMLASTALVLLMTPGLAFLYCGMVRHKNVVTTLLQCFATCGIISCLWTFVGFSLAFGAPMIDGIIGNPATYGLFRGIGAAPHAVLAPTIPFSLYFIYQLMFAIITPSLIIGSFTDRVNFTSMCLFLVLWHLVVYCPLAFMTWAPGGLIGAQWGMLDFAGGTVVHMSSGFAALVGAWYLGRGNTDLDASKEPASVPHVVLGTALLWFGWLGFNGGSAFSAGALAAHACTVTTIGAASAMTMWMLVDLANAREMSAMSICCGAVTGLIAVTPGAGFVTVGGGMCTGVMVAAICNPVMHWMDTKRERVNDTLAVFSFHGCGGLVGMMCVALFSTTAVNPHGANGLFYGELKLFWHTLVALVTVIPFICVSSYLCYWITDHIITLRIESPEASRNNDIYSKHSESMASAAKLQRRLAKDARQSERHHTNSNSNSSSKAPARQTARSNEQSTGASIGMAMATAASAGYAAGTRGGPTLDMQANALYTNPLAAYGDGQPGARHAEIECERYAGEDGAVIVLAAGPRNSK